MIKELKNAEDVLMLIQGLVDQKAYFDANNEYKDLTPHESKLEVDK